MKSILLCLVSLFVVSSATAAAIAPAALGGKLLHLQSVKDDETYTTVYRFNADGTYAVIFGEFQRTGQPVGFSTQTGRYKYTVHADGFITQLQFIFGEFGTPNIQVSLMDLQFTSPTTGYYNGQLYQTFRLTEFDSTQPMVNTSVRVLVPPGETAVAGFVINPGAHSGALIRAVGPTLAKYGVTPVLAGPALFVARNDKPLTQMGSWRSNASLMDVYEKVASTVGAFPLSRDSDDSAFFAESLVPGSYTVSCSNRGATAGQVLIEVYLLP